MALVAQLSDIGQFIRNLRVRARFGKLSRSPLSLLRLEVQGDEASCDLLARGPDPWDAGLPGNIAETHVSVQALHDAIEVRELLFRTLPEIATAELRVFRQRECSDLELVIKGKVARDQQAIRFFHSVAMRAKFFGLQFWLEDGILGTLRTEGPM